MRTETIKIYRFNELSEKAQRYAWENATDYGDDYCLDFQHILGKFEDAFGIKVYRYSVGDIYKPTFAFTMDSLATEAPKGDPLRLARYIWNNYADLIMRGKRYSSRMKIVNGDFHYVSRKSQAIKSLDDCALTGICWDADLLQPIIDCLHYKRFFNDIDELFTASLTAFFDAWQADIEYCRSFEYYGEKAEFNDFEYMEDGSRWA